MFYTDASADGGEYSRRAGKNTAEAAHRATIKASLLAELERDRPVMTVSIPGT